MPRLGSPGRCIYCPTTEGLTDEHIIPMALGGRDYLAAASCESCRVKTAKFEQVVTREMYWPLRLRIGLRGRRHKDTPTHWPGILEHGDKIEEMPIEVGKFPINYATLDYAPPGILRGVEPSDRNPEMLLTYKTDPSDIERFLTDTGAGRADFEATLDWYNFALMIGKIGHAFAVSVVGFDGVHFFLPPLIKGELGPICHYVGGIMGLNPPLDPPPSHSLELHLWSADDDMFLVVSVAHLFGRGRFPTYLAVVGRVLDMDAVIRATQSGPSFMERT